MTTVVGSDSLWESFGHTPSMRQKGFKRYLMIAILVDLVVLNLFVEYGRGYVAADSFTITLLVAVLLQVLLPLTIFLEHRLVIYFNARPGGLNRVLRFLTASLMLFGSKVVILEALSGRIHFSGPFNGLVALIALVVAMLAVEAALVKVYRSLG